MPLSFSYRSLHGDSEKAKDVRRCQRYEGTNYNEAVRHNADGEVIACSTCSQFPMLLVRYTQECFETGRLQMYEQVSPWSEGKSRRDPTADNNCHTRRKGCSSLDMPSQSFTKRFTRWRVGGKLGQRDRHMTIRNLSKVC